MDKHLVGERLTADIQAHLATGELLTARLATAQANVETARVYAESLVLRACLEAGVADPENHALQCTPAGVFLVKRPPVANPKPADAEPVRESSRAAEGGA